MNDSKIVFHHGVDIQIRFNDIDMLGHVNNAKQQEYFDLGRMIYLQRIFGLQMFTGPDAIVIVSIKSDFMIPVLLSDEVEVVTAIYHLGNKSLKMVQHLRDTISGEVKTVCESVMVAIHKSTGQSIEMPQEWKNAIMTFENPMQP